MNDLIAEQDEAARLQREGMTRAQIASAMGLSESGVKRRLAGYAKRQRLDPEIAARLAQAGVKDLAGIHSGWLLQKDKNGSGHSLYFYLGPDQERIDFAAAMRDVLSEIPRLPPLPAVASPKNDLANFVFLADLHVGGEYGSPDLEQRFNECSDDLMSRLPKAEKAVIVELGDLLDANDHKGVTPASGNYCEVIRADSLTNTMTAVRMLKRVIYRAAETHAEVEVHLIRGNHDETAYIAVLIGLAEHFADNPQVRIVVSDDDFRVILWGKCGVFPHHGDKAKWPELKDVWADMFPQAWAACEAERMIATAHFHHDRQRDMLGAHGRHFRTLAAPNKWARNHGLINRGTLTAVTFHKERGKEGETCANVKLRA